jgi:hypothetical protein
MHLRSRQLYELTMDTETKPTSAIEKSKYLNQMDEAFGTICSFISPELLFHISPCKTPNEVWTTMEGIFGKHDEMIDIYDMQCYLHQSPLGFTMQHTLHWTSSGSLILTRLAITLITSPHLVTSTV